MNVVVSSHASVSHAYWIRRGALRVVGAAADTGVTTATETVSVHRAGVASLVEALVTTANSVVTHRSTLGVLNTGLLWTQRASKVGTELSSTISAVGVRGARLGSASVARTASQREFTLIIATTRRTGRSLARELVAVVVGLTIAVRRTTTVGTRLANPTTTNKPSVTVGGNVTRASSTSVAATSPVTEEEVPNEHTYDDEPHNDRNDDKHYGSCTTRLGLLILDNLPRSTPFRSRSSRTFQR